MKKKLFFLFFLLLSINMIFGQTYKDPDASVDERVEDLLSRMTLEEKIGQMVQGSMTDVTESNVTNYFLGSVLSGGGAVPGNNTPAGWADFYDGYQDAALSTRLGIPIIYGLDAVHGHNNVRDAVIFPHNIGLGCANDPDLMERVGAVTASEVASTGVDWTFAPCVTVPRDERWGRTYEGYSEDPSIHENLVAAFINGLQGENAYMQDEKIVGCAKHWIGDGGTSGGTDRGDTICDESELRAIHMPPYINAIEANVGTIMVSFSSWNSEKLHGHQYLITDVLKNELGFEGFIISDWDGISELPGTYRDQIELSVNAGVDMFMTPYTSDWQPFITNLLDLVNSGEVSLSRIDDAVRRILRVKFMAGLFEKTYTDRTLADSFGSTEHREVGREAVRKSLVLLKNENNILPLSKTANIVVAGSAADSLRKQCGGWTIGWQGMSSDNDTSGTTILEALQAAGSNVSYNQYGSGINGYDAAIVVVGEDPYAEMSGDSTDLSLSSTDQTIINNVKNSGIPYVIILISGRPMICTDQINDADGFIAAWLPGTEGQGVADVIYGDYDFSGKLSFSWPRDMSQIPINIGDAGYDPLYAFGYGLTYDLEEDTEAPGIPSGLTADSVGSTSITLSWQASTDNVGVSGYKLYINDTVISATITTTTYTVSGLLPDTSYTFEVSAYDYAGNESERSNSLNVTTEDESIDYFSIPGTIETEDYHNYNDTTEGNSGEEYRDDDVDIEVCEEGGYNIGWIASGEWLEYYVEIAETGNYDIELRTAKEATGDASLHIEIDGIDMTDSITVPSTGGWQTFVTVSAAGIALSSGKKTMKIVMDSSDFNINWIKFTSVTGDNDPPVISITAPSDGSIYDEGENIAISVSASDSDGSVSLVEFYADGTKIGEDSTSPYSITWTDVQAGDYSLTAVATDNENASTTSGTVDISVNQITSNDPPVISITAPSDGTLYDEGESVIISASASDSDGSVSLVEFYADGTKIGEDSTSPYSITWTDVQAGDYSLTAVATDNENASTTSGSIDISVESSGVSGFAIEYNIANDWGSGFQGEVILTNNSGSTIDSWEIKFSFSGNQTIINSWSGDYSQSSQDVTITNMPWNGSLSNGQSISIGFIANYSGTNSIPSAFIVNGETVE